MSESDHDTVIIEIFVGVFPRFAIVAVTHKEGPPDAEPFFRWCVTVFVCRAHYPQFPFRFQLWESTIIDCQTDQKT